MKKHGCHFTDCVFCFTKGLRKVCPDVNVEYL